MRWPSLPLPFTVFACVGLAAACVPITRYNQAQASVQAEQAAHRKTQTERDELARKLSQVEAELAEARAVANERDAAVAAGQQRIAQTELDVSVVSKQREEAAQLVDQLRNELARSSDHLRAFSDQKKALEHALSAAEVRAKELGDLQQRLVNRAQIGRDLALFLYQNGAGKSELAEIDGQPILRVPLVQLFAGRTNTLRPTAKPVLAAVARVALLHPGTKVELTLRDPQEPEQQRALRLKRVTDGLLARGLSPAQIVLGAPPAPAATNSGSTRAAGSDRGAQPVLEFRVVS